jgi:excisionase family DNA binding protein
MVKAYNLNEAAAALGVTRRSMYTWLREGKIKGNKVGREYRILEEEIDRVLKHGLERGK